jgi:penicillin-insensitive murein endopeptidase
MCSHVSESKNSRKPGFERPAALALCAVLLFAHSAANAQDKGTLDPKPLPPLAKPDGLGTLAKELFARKTTPSQGPARSIGFYSHGCIAGAVALPVDGETWQVMRVSRNRNWGHPELIQFIEQLADKATRTGWHGLLIGDMSQPRGGPLLAGHTSHQVGLDVHRQFRNAIVEARDGDAAVVVVHRSKNFAQDSCTVVVSGAGVVKYF